MRPVSVRSTRSRRSRSSLPAPTAVLRHDPPQGEDVARLKPLELSRQSPPIVPNRRQQTAGDPVAFGRGQEGDQLDAHLERRPATLLLAYRLIVHRLTNPLRPGRQHVVKQTG